MSEGITGGPPTQTRAQAASPPGRRPPTSRGFWTDAWRRLRHNRLAMASLGFLVCLGLAAGVAPLFLPYSHEKQDLFALYASPRRAHWVGTDPLGRDPLSRPLIGARVSVAVGIVAGCITMSLAPVAR